MHPYPAQINRVCEASSEAELWKIANEVTNPKKSCEWSIEINGKEEKNELKIAEAFNYYFVNKITKLKEGIDQALVVDPLEKLKIQWDLNTKLVWYSNG